MTTVVALAEAVIRARSRSSIERRMRVAVARIFRGQRRAFPAHQVAVEALARRPSPLTEVAQPKDPGDPLQQIVAAAWPAREEQMGRVIAFHGAEAVQSAGELTLAAVGRPRNDSMIGVVADWLAERSLTRAEGIEQTSIERIRNVLARGVEADRTAKDIAREIRAEFDGWTRSSARGRLTPEERAIVRRADMIARTEIAEAWETASYQVLTAEGWDAREWLTAGDDRADGPCLANQAAGPVPIGQPFPSGHMYPPLHPLCRCTTVPSFR